ncbi:MAG: hypothetical protein PVF29_06765 [Desulfobacterales bacterium]|jgi:5'-phosphate synthase pdxT subunit
MKIGVLALQGAFSEHIHMLGQLDVEAVEVRLPEELYVSVLKEGDAIPFPGVFIRSPKLVQTRGRAVMLAHLADGTPVAAIEGTLLATAFHPELTHDTRFHQYFLSLISG